MASRLFDSPIVRAFNAVATGLIAVPVLGGLVRRSLVVVRYTGRRSGTTFETPVNYRRVKDTVTIRVMSPDAKSWWRNFTGDGGPITLVGLDGSDRTGHAIATRDQRGRVSVTVSLG